VALHAALSPDGVLHVEVRDQGRWRQRRGGTIPGDETRMPLLGRGRGLEMVRGLLDTLHVEPGPDGTTVRITHRLTWPARLLTTDEVHSGATPAPPRRPDTAQLHVANQATSTGTRLRLDGPLDAATAQGLEIELQRRTRGGTQAVTLDLTGVTHLASAGVAVLHTVKGLRFFAPAGSVAQQVLTLVALPHLTRDPDHADADATTPDGLPGWLDDTRSGGEHAGGHHVEDEVHQATGVVMTQLGLPATDALARLRAHSFAHHRPLLDIARDVIEGRLRFTGDMP
jgi:ABC-type transporter Mla MlaB component